MQTEAPPNLGSYGKQGAKRRGLAGQEAGVLGPATLQSRQVGGRAALQGDLNGLSKSPHWG